MSKKKSTKLKKPPHCEEGAEHKEDPDNPHSFITIHNDPNAEVEELEDMDVEWVAWRKKKIEEQKSEEEEA